MTKNNIIYGVDFKNKPQKEKDTKGLKFFDDVAHSYDVNCPYCRIELHIDIVYPEYKLILSIDDED